MLQQDDVRWYHPPKGKPFKVKVVGVSVDMGPTLRFYIVEPYDGDSYEDEDSVSYWEAKSWLSRQNYNYTHFVAQESMLKERSY